MAVCTARLQCEDFLDGYTVAMETDMQRGQRPWQPSLPGAGWLLYSLLNQHTRVYDYGLNFFYCVISTLRVAGNGAC